MHDALFVTGITGFLGRSLLRAVEADERLPSVVGVGRDRSALSRCAQSPVAVAMHSIDLSDASCVRSLTAAISDAAAQGVVHMAALVTSQVDDESSAHELVRANVGGTIHLWRAIADVPAQHRPRRLVLVSSVLVYGWPHTRAVAETAAAAPRDNYGLSKLGAEEYSRYFARRLGVELVTLRVGYVYGPGDRSGKVIYRFLEQAAQGAPLTVTSSPGVFRDYVYVTDVVRAIRWAADGTPPPAIVNVSSGEPSTPADVARVAVEVTGSASDVVCEVSASSVAGPSADYGCTLMCSALGARLLGPWTSLRQGMAQTAEGIDA